MAGLGNLAKRMATLEKEIKAKTNGAVQSLADAMVRSMYENTAVDTSKALSNWRIAIGSQPPVGDIPAHSLGSFGSTRDSSGSTMQKIAYAAISMRRVGEEIHLYNNVDYILKLEKSHPVYSGMVSKAMSAGSAQIKVYYAKNKLGSGTSTGGV